MEREKKRGQREDRESLSEREKGEEKGERGMNRLKGEKRGKETRSERGVETITHHDPIGDTRGGRGW